MSTEENNNNNNLKICCGCILFLIIIGLLIYLCCSNNESLVPMGTPVSTQFGNNIGNINGYSNYAFMGRCNTDPRILNIGNKFKLK